MIQLFENTDISSRNSFGVHQTAKKIVEFDTLFPKTDITDVKKLDFMLWQER